jgi:putative FmdB family regulatory protein
MPTYEYVCDACGNEFENFASMSAPPIKKCPKCKKNKVHRKISTGGGIIFKGGGFYETDYRGDAYKNAAAAEKSSGEAKPAETKPAETATPAAKTDAPATKSDASTKPEPAAKPIEKKSEPAPVARSSSSKTRKR